MALTIGTINLKLPSSLDSGAYTYVVGIDCGGPGFTAVDGTVYLSDRHYTGGNTATTTDAIANTLDDVLYQTERWGACTYTIPVTASTYRVRVQLAEIYNQITAAGQRVFTVNFQPGTTNAQSFTNIDQFALAGYDTATEVVADIVVGADGLLVIQTLAQVQQPALKGLLIQSNAGGTYNPGAGPITPTPPAAETTVVRSTNFTIPAEFVGIHCSTVPSDVRGYHSWGSATPPAFPYGIRRSHDYEGVFWADIHSTSAGQQVYNWTYLDALVDHTRSKGAELLYTVMCTPAHLASVPGYPSPYPNFSGSTSMPNDLTLTANFITALVQRYNSGGVRKIKALEIWNEPEVDGTNYYPLTGTKSYWIGSVTGNTAGDKSQRLADLALLHKTIAVAARAVDPGILIVAPGWCPGGAAETSSNWTSYFSRSITGGGTPLDYTDIFACHPYNNGTYGTTASNLNTLLATYNSCRNAVTSAKPLWGTEAGTENTGSFTVSTYATTIRRKAMLAAGNGLANVCWYSYEDDDRQPGLYLGNPFRNSLTSTALSDLTAKMTGRVMSRCSILNDGTVWAAFTDGTTFRE